MRLFFIFVSKMDKQSIIKSIKEEKSFLTGEFGVEEIGLFGSYARGEETSESDIDIFVSLKTPNLKSLMGVYTFLEKKLNKKIDLVRKGPHLSVRFLNLIKKDLIYV